MLQEHSNHIVSLRITILMLSVALCLSLYALIKAPDKITVYIPPNTANGAIMNIGDIPKSRILSDTSYLWIELNTWIKDGKKDAIANLDAYRYYFSDRFREQLEVQYKDMDLKGELDRRRRITLVPGTMFNFDKRVIEQSKNQSWIVLIDVVIEDFFLGERVQNVKVRYPLKVERIETNYDQNPLGIIITGFEGHPKEITEL
nr:TIGR03746 family integrating conjugative element protein [Vibrio sp. 1180_3]